MSPDALFTILNGLAACGWLLLVLLPRRRWATDLIAGFGIPAILAVSYTLIVVTVWGRSDGSFSTLAGVAALFREPWLLLAGWAHYLAFDLFIGSWEVRDSRDRGIPHLLVVPCLILTFLFGPVGWLLYGIVRSVKSRTPALGVA